MKFKTRLFIILPFFIFFIISIFLVILYVKGYRFDFEKNKIVQTGSLYLNSYPQGANVFINQEIQKGNWYNKIFFWKTIFGLTKFKGTTPSLINNLLPGYYLITIQKPDYQKWEKKLKIESQKTTFAEKIELFKNVPKQIYFKKLNISTLFLSNSKQKMAYLEKNGYEKIKLFDFKNLKEKEIIETKQKIKDLQFSDQENYLIFQTERNKFFLVNLDNFKIIDLSSFFPYKINSIIWGPNEKLFLNTGNKIFNFDSKTLNYKNIYFSPEKISDILIKNNSLFILKKKNSNYFLEYNNKKINLGSFQNLNFLKQQPLADILQLKNNHYIVIFDLKKEKIIDKFLGEKIKWFKERAIWQNNFDLNLGQLIEKNNERKIKKDVLIRISQKINNLYWHPRGEYIFYTNGNTLYIIELDPRDKRNIYKIFQGEKILDIFYKNNLLTILTNSGIYILKIQ